MLSFMTRAYCKLLLLFVRYLQFIISIRNYIYLELWMLRLKVLKHLTVKRPVEASRMDFFAHAEAFAALVNLEFVSINGTLKY